MDISIRMSVDVKFKTLRELWRKEIDNIYLDKKTSCIKEFYDIFSAEIQEAISDKLFITIETDPKDKNIFCRIYGHIDFDFSFDDEFIDKEFKDEEDELNFYIEECFGQQVLENNYHTYQNENLRYEIKNREGKVLARFSHAV